ncbi:MAG TPA: O-antigen ligase family protein [Gaiellaceae bacterium]|nr:O-antigen ligase family protein [Gaiellaceae bacterium]
MTALGHVGGPLGCLGLAVLLHAPQRLHRLAGLAAWALGSLFLIVYLAPSGHDAVYAAGGAAGVAVAVGGAVVLRRWTWLLPAGTLLLAPARVPVTVGATDASLLVPLYVLVGAAAVLLAWELAHGDRRSRELRSVSLPLALFLAWSGLSLSWTTDLKRGAIELLFFYLPFGLLALALARLEWRPRIAPLLYAQLAAMAVLFALVGLYQRAAHDVFWNPKVIVGNAYQPFFRVNSLFWDPSIYGRFLVIAILVSLAVVLASTDDRVRLAAAGVVALSWAGLFFSYSQSSFAALIVGVLAAAAVAFRPRPAAVSAAAALLAACLLAARPARAPAFPAAPAVLADATSGRGKLVTRGIRIALDHPLQGVGIGGFERAYAKRAGLAGAAGLKRSASHTTPVTVAAETGIVGLALFAWLAVAGLALAFRRAAATASGVVPLGVGLTLLAIAVHSLGYDALFEDPMGWGALGLAACVATARWGEEPA